MNLVGVDTYFKFPGILLSVGFVTQPYLFKHAVANNRMSRQEVQNDGIKQAFMKFVITIQRVKVPSSQSLANRLVANPAGKSGDGRPKPGGTRMQAA